MQVGRRQLRRTPHLPAQLSPQDLAHWSQLQHLQVCAESKHLLESLQKKRCLQKRLVLGLDQLCSGCLAAFLSLESKGRRKAMCVPIPDPTQV